MCRLSGKAVQPGPSAPLPYPLGVEPEHVEQFTDHDHPDLPPDLRTKVELVTFDD
jgi:hypothetical protein